MSIKTFAILKLGGCEHAMTTLRTLPAWTPCIPFNMGSCGRLAECGTQLWKGVRHSTSSGPPDNYLPTFHFQMQSPTQNFWRGQFLSGKAKKEKEEKKRVVVEKEWGKDSLRSVTVATLTNQAFETVGI